MRQTFYSIILNRVYLNVSFMFLESQYRAPQEDSLTIVRGQVGSYPNLLLEVPAAKTAAFVEQIQALKAGDDSWRKFVDAWGVRRRSPEFWTQFDWFNAQQRSEEPIEGGVLDLNRYLND